MLLPGQPGFDKANDSYYSYDPGKAKNLLAQAGYSGGFTFTGMCFTLLGTCPVAQAVASSLSKVGVTMKVDQESAPATFNQKFGSGTVPAVFFGMGDTTFLSAQQWLPTNSFQNSYKSSDERLTSAYNELAAAQSESASDRAASKLVSRALDLAWFAPVARLDTIYYVKGVSNVKWTAAAPGYYSPTDPSGKYSWRMSR
jgi:peptide/nickel transport system substrate-binding protein